jgi:hypothetical protein
MSAWTPATKEEVQRAIELEKIASDPSSWKERAHLLVDPYPCSVERFGGVEQAFVVAKGPHRVVYFDDVKKGFGTANELDGRLLDRAACGPLVLALKEAALGA